MSWENRVFGQMGKALKSAEDEADIVELEFNFQRKIDAALTEKNKKLNERNNCELIVVASLLDKLPNLANLTRTCEVFGATQLVFPNKNVVSNQEYKKVSVTSELWMPILEVKPGDLLDFVRMKKSLGYTIVGLEQTSKSVMLDKFGFPKKCVLVLGKEKTGIPLELIKEMDFCVEIQQFGKIRSLNVHISAVICIWEYVKQNFIQKSE